MVHWEHQPSDWLSSQASAECKSMLGVANTLQTSQACEEMANVVKHDLDTHTVYTYIFSLIIQ